MFKPNQITETESRDMMLDSYVTHIRNHRCTNCGQTETFTQCFEVWLHPTKTRSSNLRDLRAVVGDTLKPLNMAVLTVPEKKIPICHHCASQYRVVGRPEIVIARSTNEQWQETLRRKHAQAQTEKVAKPAAPVKTVPRLDQI
jgi:hypothetical protein